MPAHMCRGRRPETRKYPVAARRQTGEGPRARSVAAAPMATTTVVTINGTLARRSAEPTKLLLDEPRQPKTVVRAGRVRTKALGVLPHDSIQYALRVRSWRVRGRW